MKRSRATCSASAATSDDWSGQENTRPEGRFDIGRVEILLRRMQQTDVPRDYLSAAYGCALDTAIWRVVDGFVLSDDATRHMISIAPLPPEKGVLFVEFAERMSHLARSQRNSVPLHDGLVALILVEKLLSPAELVRALGRFYQTAYDLGADPAEIFKRAAALATSQLAEVLEGFAHRDADGRIF